jgi:hypothetical protein
VDRSDRPGRVAKLSGICLRLTLTAPLTLAANVVPAQATPNSQMPDSAGGSRPVNVPLFDCNSLWDPTTHMSKQQWARACVRVQGRLQEIQAIEDSAPRLPKD